ncbi:MAG: LapA family protein [Deltaproteobacteria bacterium]|nr:LapA family protein [Deltaproteobacteria bacterium]
MKVIYTVIVAIFVMFIITFSLENTEPVKLHYLGYEFFMGPIPTYMLIFIAFLSGVIFTGFMGIVERFRLNRTINRLNKTIRDLRRETKVNENPPYIEEGGKTIWPSREEIL